MAEGDQIQWLNGRASVPGVVEKICPMRHIGQGQWESEWNEMYLNDRSKWCYEYISDYECIFDPTDVNLDNLMYLLYRERWTNLQVAKRQGTNVPIVNLSHFTTLDAAEGIIMSGGFKAGLKKINEEAQGNAVQARFSWWVPSFSEAIKKQVRNNIGTAIKPFVHLYDDDDDDDDDALIQLKNQFATSDAFIPNPARYGPVSFNYSIDDLCQQYSNHFEGDVQFKILGTFGYKKEVMHAVLVCSQGNGAGIFTEYPDVLTPEEDANNDAVVTRDNYGNWVWRPQATGSEVSRLAGQNIYPMYRRWENVAFAFHLPNEMEKITVSDLKNHVNGMSYQVTGEN